MIRTLPLAVIFTTLALAAGPLTPPPGAPAPNMKTLQEIYDSLDVRARIVPGATFNIGTAGVYQLQEDWTFTTSGASPIVVNPGVSTVVIELNGRSLVGAAGTLAGISVSPGTRLVVRGGFIRGFGGAGISASGCESIVEDLEARDCGDDGIRVGPRSVLRNVFARNNGGDGIECDEGCDVGFADCRDNTGVGIRGTVRVSLFDPVVELNDAGGIVLSHDALVVRGRVRLNLGAALTLGDRGQCKDLDASDSTAATNVFGQDCVLENSRVFAPTVTVTFGPRLVIRAGELQVGVFTASGAVRVESGTVTVTGTITVTGGDFVASGAVITAGSLTVSTGSFVSSSGSVTVTGTVTVTGGGLVTLQDLRVTAGSLNLAPTVRVTVRDSRFKLTTPGMVSLGAGTVWRDNDCDGAAGSSVGFGEASTVNGSKFTGLKVVAGDNASVTNTTVTGATGYGIDAGANCLVKDCVASQITKDISSGEPGVGIRIGDSSAVVSCVVCYCDSHGIQISAYCHALQNSSSRNGAGQNVTDGAGIYASANYQLIDGNLCDGNDVGIALAGLNATVIRNKLGNNPPGSGTAPLTGSAGNDVAPIGSAATATNPFTNFQ